MRWRLALGAVALSACSGQPTVQDASQPDATMDVPPAMDRVDAPDATDAMDAPDAADGPDAVEAGDVFEAGNDAADAGDEATDAMPDGDAAGTSLRIMAGNLTSGTDQSYTPGEGARLFAAMHPDVALVQEFNNGSNSSSDLRAFVDGAFGTSYQYVRGAGDIPNGVVSRYPIVASGDWTDPSVANRTFVWARIDVPGAHDLWAVSLHLLTTSATNRATEVASLVARIEASVPSGDLLAVGGDLNTEARNEPGITMLSAVVVTDAPYPVDQTGNDNTSGPRSKPHDWLLAGPDLAQRETAVAIGSHAFDHGLVFDSRVYSPLSDVPPARATDSAASGMQHMGVVRQFVVGP